MPRWREDGYRITMYYVRLDAVETSIERVRRRVAAGGHGIPEVDLRRRFRRSLANFEEAKSLVDEWHLIDSFEGRFEHVEEGRSNVADE